MDESRWRSRPPTIWTWVVGAILVIAIVWVVFALVSRKGGSHNERLPKAQIPAGSMVASSELSPHQIALSSAVTSV